MGISLQSPSRSDQAEMTDQGIPIGATAIKPIERHGWEAFSWFMYDKNTGAIMGRTPLSWLLITVFYIIYYSCLAGFWALCLFIFYQFIEDHQPRWQMADGLIGKSPALGVRPGQHDSIIESSVIIFNHENPNDDENIPGYQQWVDRLDEYLKPYRAAPASENGMDCATDSAATDGKFCKFDLAKLGVCGQEGTKYGFDSSSTCLVLKLNKIFGLEHEYYDNAEELPEEMPAELKERIKAAVAGGRGKQVWVSCKAEFPADKEGIKDIQLFPADGGFPSQYFPYVKQEDYQSPLVAVKINDINPGQLIHVECRAWAKNIKYNRRDRVGIVRFEVMNHNDQTTEEVNKMN